MKKTAKRILFMFSPLLALVSVASATELSVTGDRFAVDGKPTFLLGCSYYGALGASDATIRSDLDELQRLHFNWIRVWADWTAFGADLSAVDGATGEPRQPYLDKLVKLCADCDRRGMIVDVTFTRGKGVGGKPMLSDPAAQQRAVETVTKALSGTKNCYLDLSNERNIGDARHTSIAELAALHEAVRKINPKLLITASHGGDASRDEVLAYLNTAHLNFLSIHRPRDVQSAARISEATHEYRTWIKENGRVVPLMYDEPMRRGYANWEPTAQDFATDLKASRDAGAAGWCFHNGDTRKTKDHEPRRSFDLRNHSLFDQLDIEEKKFLADLPKP